MAEPCLHILEIRPATGFLPNSTSAKPEFLTKCLMKTVSVARELLRPFFFPFINLRYGRDGHTFDGGKRIFLKDGRTHKVHWNVNESPHGRQLVMNAYKGTVRVVSVEIRYH